ncbi:MAG: translation initiation factor IF-2 [Chlamydiae bacterium]|nr:translation initiation factor IF-2 [Chlamydiota bacterium]
MNQLKKPTAVKKALKPESEAQEKKEAEAVVQVPVETSATVSSQPISNPESKEAFEPAETKSLDDRFSKQRPSPAHESTPRSAHTFSDQSDSRYQPRTNERPPHRSPSSDSRPPRQPYGSQDNRFSRPYGERQGGSSAEGRFNRPSSDRPGFSGRPPSDSRFPRQNSEGRPPYSGSAGDSRFQRPHGEGRPPYSGSAGDSRFQRPHGEGRPPYSGSAGDSRFPRSSDRSGPGGPRPQGAYPSTRPPFRRDSAVVPDVKKVFPSSKDHPTREAPPAKKSFSEDDKFKKASPVKDTKDAKGAKKIDGYRSFDARDRQGLTAGEEEGWRKKKIFKAKSQFQEEVIRPKSLKVRLPISVKDLANEMKLKSSQLVAKLFMQGVVITLNDLLDDETTIQLLGHEFECDISIDTKEEKRLQVTDKTIKEEIKEANESDKKLRPPVVTFMGHVDHGKTSLIDAIRKSNRVASEAGAITQHIGAFKCHTAVGDITILDTPGHEAFSAMRSRGADVTDIVVLVVAGDEGIKTQTIEAMEQALAANVPIVVAINKSDKPNFNPETVYRQLADRNLLPEAWGGSIITVNCSAFTGAGIKDLLEMLALQAEVLELKATPDFRARGSVIESELHKGLGAVATILVQNGTLRIGDSIVFGQNYARIKTLHDEFGKELTAAGPSTPVKITGLSGLPEAGSEFIAVKDEKEARDISQKRTAGQKHMLLHQAKKASLENLLQQKADSFTKKTLPIIVKADVQGSLEALKTSLLKIPSKKVDINFIAEGVGEVSESDIQLAAASKAMIIGFHTKIESHAESLIKQLKVNVRLHDIIYHAVDDTKELMLALLDKIPQENEVGKAEVRAVFKSSQLGNIAGCQVTEGTIKRNCLIRVLRGKEMIWKGNISSLKRVKEDVKEVSKGIECGIVLQNFSDVKEGDILQAIEITYLTQDLN